MKVMTVSLSPNPSPARGEGRFVSRIRDFHIKIAGSVRVLYQAYLTTSGSHQQDPEHEQASYR
jgi:hypothetical protein